MRDAFGGGRVDDADRDFGDMPAETRGAEQRFGFERVTVRARAEREGFGHGIAAQAALRVVERDAAEPGEKDVGKAVREATRAGRSVAHEIAHAENERLARRVVKCDASGFVGRVLPVGVDGDDGADPRFLGEMHAGSQRGAFAEIFRVAEEHGSGALRLGGRSVRRAVVHDDDAGPVSGRERAEEPFHDGGDAFFGLKRRNDGEDVHARDTNPRGLPVRLVSASMPPPGSMDPLDPRLVADLAVRAKKQLRARMRALRSAHPEKARAERSARLVARVIALPEFVSARGVALFASLLDGGEVDVRALDQAARTANKRIFYPTIERKGDRDHTALAEVSDPTELAMRGRRFAEPPESARRAARGDVDLVVVPALALAATGHRLGYGGGFYDAMLPDFCPPAVAVAVAFDFQLIAELPAEPHDVPCDIVVTDARTLVARTSA